MSYEYSKVETEGNYLNDVYELVIIVPYFIKGDRDDVDCERSAYLTDGCVGASSGFNGPHPFLG